MYTFEISMVLILLVLAFFVRHKGHLKLIAIKIGGTFFKKKEPVSIFYRKEDGSPGYMSTKEIAEAMKPRPMTQEYEDKLPWEFAKTLRKILEAENAHK